MKINAAQAQEKYGINRSSIGRWIKAGKLVCDDDFYFVESDFLVIFRKSKSWKALSQAKKDEFAPELPLNEPNQLTGEFGGVPHLDNFDREAFGGGNEYSKIDLDRQKLKEEIREKRRKNSFGEGKLIERPLVTMFVGRLGEIDTIEWRSLSSRVCDDLMAILGTSNQEDRTKIVARLDEEVYLILQSVKLHQKNFLSSLPRIDN